MKHKWFRRLLRRRVFVVVMLVLQMAFIVYTVASRSVASHIINRSLSLLSLAVCIHIIASRSKGAYKLTWVFHILLFPVFGGLFYLMFTFQSTTMKYRKLISHTNNKSKDLFLLPTTASERAYSDIPEHAAQIRYLQNYVSFPIYFNGGTEYLSPGEAFLSRLTEELKKAESYIFLEYFIVQEGKMWTAIHDILKEKVAAGVKVRLLYDDMGSFFLLPKDFPDILRAEGIECEVFNRFRPFLTTVQNNRDHRKIAVIDGKVAFTGGINIADEYINEFEKHGYWKDASIMVRGDAAWSFTLMFLSMWELACGADEDYSKYFPANVGHCRSDDADASRGFVQPYCDNPLDKENIGEHVYMQMINGARDYLYINTPYLIIDDSMVSALCLAAKSGVDVRIVTPYKWDKWIVHMTTRSYYRELIGAGVKIYEYSRGFIHSKTFVSDDTAATVGTVNLDFRSLYLHFECGVWMHGTEAVMQVKDDFLRTLTECRQITEDDCRHNLLMRIFQDFMRLFAPLM